MSVFRQHGDAQQILWNGFRVFASGNDITTARPSPFKQDLSVHPYRSLSSFILLYLIKKCNHVPAEATTSLPSAAGPAISPATSQHNIGKSE